MSSWTSKFSAREKEAIVDAVLSGRHRTAAAAARAAAAGELAGVGKFEIAYSTARHLVREARANQASRELRRPEVMDTALNELAATMLETAQTELQRLQAEPVLDLSRMKELAMTLKQIRGIVRAPRTKPQTGTDETEHPDPNEHGNTSTSGLEQLLAQLQSGNNDVIQTRGVIQDKDQDANARTRHRTGSAARDGSLSAREEAAA